MPDAGGFKLTLGTWRDSIVLMNRHILYKFKLTLGVWGGMLNHQRQREPKLPLVA